jgi:hypothetical protein
MLKSVDVVKCIENTRVWCVCVTICNYVCVCRDKKFLKTVCPDLSKPLPVYSSLPTPSIPLILPDYRLEGAFYTQNLTFFTLIERYFLLLFLVEGIET